MRFQNYFVVNGKTYYTGTIIVVKNMGNKEKATFICYDTEHDRYIYKIRDCRHNVPAEYFWRNLIEITEQINFSAKAPEVKTLKDSQIDGLALGWIWYIFLMAISVIFKDAIGLWILISIVFFSWRADKIKKGGKYIEW